VRWKLRRVTFQEAIRNGTVSARGAAGLVEGISILDTAKPVRSYCPAKSSERA